MNHQNMMHQFFDQQQQSSSMNGFPGPGFQPNQQIPNSFTGPTGGANSFMGSSSFRQQNGLSRFGMNDSDNFEMQQPNPPNSSQQSQQGYPNFMDPRIAGYDPRNRPSFDPNNMIPGMDYGGNSNYSAKMRMNEMAAMFGGPAAMAAIQRQRMNMFGQGRDSDFMSPTNPYGAFNPQQAAQIMQQQRVAAYQRQVQEQMANQHMAGGNRNSDLNRSEMNRADLPRTDVSRGDTPRSDVSRTDIARSDANRVDTTRADITRTDNSRPVDMARADLNRQEGNRQDISRQYSSPSGSLSGTSSGNGPVSDSNFNQNSQDGFSGAFSPQSRQTSSHLGDGTISDIASNQGVNDHRSSGNPNTGKNTLNDSSLSNKYPNPPSGPSTPRMSFEQQGNESQRNAAMLAAAAVRAAAAASTRARGGFTAPSPGGNNYPFALRGYPPNMDQMPSPYPSQGMQSPEYGGVMSPARESVSNSLSQSPISQGRGTPRNGNPPPYSPMSHAHESNMSGSMSSKSSFNSASANIQKSNSSVKNDEVVTSGHNMSLEAGGTPSVGSGTSKTGSLVEASPEKGVDPNHVNNDRNPTVNKSSSSTATVDTNNTINNSFCNTSQNGSAVNSNNPKLSATPSSVPASSPSPASFQEDIEIDNLSPSWPHTPLSPSAQKLLKAQASPKHYDQLSKVYDLIDDDEKRNFLDRYLAFMSVNGTPVTKLPVISKQPLDLYTLFRAVCERGGIQEVMEKRRFKEILTCLNLPIGNTLAYMVKEQYMKYLHAYEIKAKDVLLKQWKTSITLSNDTPTSKLESVPTIALNDSFRPDVKSQTNQSQHNSFHPNSSEAVSSWNQNMFSTTSTTMSMTSSSEPSQYGPHMSYPNPPPNQGLPTYGQPGMSGYGGQDMPPGYPGYPNYQNPMYPRAPLQNYNSMHPNLSNENMPGSWPRGFPPRQGPPELFPEGLQRMPWNQSSQRHPMSAFSSPSYQSGKSKGSVPPISRDSMEHMKYNAQQQQMKMQQFQHQQQMQKQRFPTPDGGKMSKVTRVAVPEARPAITPAQPTKREFNFPPGSVEATQPIKTKRKKLTSKELGPVEAWRIMMSLKSGLVAECTWAIDTLNILLADNNTITYFHLNQLPGLLDTLMDHYRRSLAHIFQSFADLEIPLLPEVEKSEPETIDQKLFDLWVGVCKNSKTSHTSNIASTAILNGSAKEKLESGKTFWEEGGGDNTSHVQTSFPTENVPLKSFPDGILYVTKVEEEKQRRLEKAKKARLLASTKNLNNEKLSELDNSPKSPVIAYISANATEEPKVTKTFDKEDMVNSKSNETNEEVSTACLGVLDDLLNESSEQTTKVDEEDPLIEKILADLDFNIPCDRRYLEDSKEFIEYLNRRLSVENRGNVVSEQCVVKQSTPLVDVSESEQCLLNRCVALSNVFRSLSFIQGNDSELASHIGLMLFSGYILLHKHKHAVTDHSQFKLGLDERTVLNNAISDSEPDFWWDSIHAIRENTLVMLSNIGGHLNLNRLKEKIYKPLIEGLLHWLVCRSSESIDSMPTAPALHALSAKKLALETLAKMTINSANIELVISSQPESRLGEINDVLLKQVGKKHPVPSREFAIILLDNLAHNEKFNKVLASRKSAIRNLVKFVYEAEKNTSNFLSSGGRVQPGLNAEDICGTSISLLRRSVNIILSIVKLPCNRRALSPYTDDLLNLSTSQMIDTSVLALLAQVLFELEV